MRLSCWLAYPARGSEQCVVGGAELTEPPLIGDPASSALLTPSLRPPVQVSSRILSSHNQAALIVALGTPRSVFTDTPLRSPSTESMMVTSPAPRLGHSFLAESVEILPPY